MKTPNQLAERVAAKAGTDVATRTQAAPPKTLQQQLEAMVPQFARAMPKHLSPDRLARIALTEYRRNPELANCSPQSFFGALMQAAQLGLEPGLVGHSYLVPFKNRKTGTREVQFMVGYKGMLDLVRRSGEVVGTPQARIVYMNDEFDLHFSLHGTQFKHVPWHMRIPQPDGPGEIRGAYCHVIYKAGGGDVHYFPISEIHKRRNRSMAKDSGPWQTDYEAMVLKTAVRAAFPWMPVSVEIQKDVVESDERVVRLDADTFETTFADANIETVPAEVENSAPGKAIEAAPASPREDDTPPPPDRLFGD